MAQVCTCRRFTYARGRHPPLHGCQGAFIAALGASGWTGCLWTTRSHRRPWRPFVLFCCPKRITSAQLQWTTASQNQTTGKRSSGIADHWSCSTAQGISGQTVARPGWLGFWGQLVNPDGPAGRGAADVPQTSADLPQTSAGNVCKLNSQSDKGLHQSCIRCIRFASSYAH